jgi:hypothetical protein
MVGLVSDPTPAEVIDMYGIEGPEPIPRGHWPDDQQSRDYEDYLNGIAEDAHNAAMYGPEGNYREDVCVHCGSGMLVPAAKTGDVECRNCLEGWGEA